jgi:hypothetical protein
MTIMIQNHQPDPRRQTRQLRQTRAYNISLADLITDEGALDVCMITWLYHRREDGAVLMLWSDKGKHHARQESRSMGIESLFVW